MENLKNFKGFDSEKLDIRDYFLNSKKTDQSILSNSNRSESFENLNSGSQEETKTSPKENFSTLSEEDKKLIEKANKNPNVSHRKSKSENFSKSKEKTESNLLSSKHKKSKSASSKMNSFEFDSSQSDKNTKTIVPIQIIEQPPILLPETSENNSKRMGSYLSTIEEASETSSNSSESFKTAQSLNSDQESISWIIEKPCLKKVNCSNTNGEQEIIPIREDSLTNTDTRKLDNLIFEQDQNAQENQKKEFISSQESKSSSNKHSKTGEKSRKNLEKKLEKKRKKYKETKKNLFLTHDEQIKNLNNYYEESIMIIKIHMDMLNEEDEQHYNPSDAFLVEKHNQRMEARKELEKEISEELESMYNSDLKQLKNLHILEQKKLKKEEIKFQTQHRIGYKTSSQEPNQYLARVLKGGIKSAKFLSSWCVDSKKKLYFPITSIQNFGDSEGNIENLIIKTEKKAIAVEEIKSKQCESIATFDPIMNYTQPTYYCYIKISDHSYNFKNQNNNIPGYALMATIILIVPLILSEIHNFFSKKSEQDWEK